MDKEKISRSFGGNVFQNEDTNGRLVSGYAIRFNEPSQNMGFIEYIDRNAVTQELIDNSDIFAKLNHRDDVILARSRYGKGSLHLELREDGLYYEFESPNSIWGDELLEHIKRGEISTSSFAFTLNKSDRSSESWKKENGKFIRTIHKIEGLYDISPTFEGAYLSTSCSARALEMIKTSEEINAKLDAELKTLDDLFNM